MTDAGERAVPATDVWRKDPAATEALSRVVVVDGPNRGAALVLARARGTVGRHATNDLVLADGSVSAVHLELERRSSARLLVRDSGSTNGTWLGPHRLVEMELGPGAILLVGGSTLRVEVAENVAVAPASPSRRFEGLVGSSEEMREVFALLDRVAPKPLSLLVQGETGTGKEEVARAVHRASPRAGGPFEVLDSTTIPAALAESVLFGHERGAFTSAESRHVGAFERAHGGTLFIDEVGDLPAALQPKLLRVLERRELVRVGGRDTVRIDVRVVTATHRDLRKEIERGRFREDLYFRLAQVRIVVPPLRARATDIPELARHFLSESPETRGHQFEPEALEELARRPFPGNVRELKNVVLRAAALSEDGWIRAVDLTSEGFGARGAAWLVREEEVSMPFASAKQKAVARFEREYLEALMRRARGNISRASREADLARHHLRELLKKHELYAPVDPDADMTGGESPETRDGVR